MGDSRRDGIFEFGCFHMLFLSLNFCDAAHGISYSRPIAGCFLFLHDKLHIPGMDSYEIFFAPLPTVTVRHVRALLARRVSIADETLFAHCCAGWGGGDLVDTPDTFQLR